jgi:hypothetical protein
MAVPHLFSYQALLPQALSSHYPCPWQVVAQEEENGKGLENFFFLPNSFNQLTLQLEKSFSYLLIIANP